MDSARCSGFTSAGSTIHFGSSTRLTRTTCSATRKRRLAQRPRSLDSGHVSRSLVRGTRNVYPARNLPLAIRAGIVSLPLKNLCQLTIRDWITSIYSQVTRM